MVRESLFPNNFKWSPKLNFNYSSDDKCLIFKDYYVFYYVKFFVFLSHFKFAFNKTW